MTTRVRASIFPVGCAALLPFLACNPGESASPSPEPTATATPSPSASAPACCEAPYGRWAVVVVYGEKSGACDKVAGPPRVGARRGETITWRIYNRCAKDATVVLTDFLRYEKDPGVPTPEQEAYPKKPPQGAEGIDPFVDGIHSSAVKAGAISDLSLKIKTDAKYGVYAYTTKLSGRPDADQQIEIWP